MSKRRAVSAMKNNRVFGVYRALLGVYRALLGDYSALFEGVRGSFEM